MEGILALDPAGPIFSSNSENSIHAPLGNKLWKTDAKAVQALHTNVKGSFHLGYDGDLGSVDFYLNDATTQPGCYDMYCSHSYGQQLLISLNAAYSEIGYRNDNEMHCHNSKLVILLIRISLTSPSALLLQGVPSARGLGWVDLDFEYSTVCPILPWADGSLAEVAGQLGKPGPRANGTPCTILLKKSQKSVQLTKGWLFPCSLCPVSVQNMLILPTWEPETIFCAHGLNVTVQASMGPFSTDRIFCPLSTSHRWMAASSELEA